MVLLKSNNKQNELFDRSPFNIECPITFSIEKKNGTWREHHLRNGDALVTPTLISTTWQQVVKNILGP